MSIELLDRTRKVMSLLTEDGKDRIGFSQLCGMVSGFLSSNVYIISKRGKILGAGIDEASGSLPGFPDGVGECIEERLNERFLSILSTKENVNLETLGFEEYDVDGLTALISPVCIRGERLGSFFMYRKDRTYRIDDIILCEYCNAVIGLLLTNSLMVETGEIKDKKEAISSAIRALTELERKAVALVIHNLSGSEGLVVTSKLASQYGITRSVIVGALKKLESARLIRTQSSGVKGTKIEVLNDIVYDEFERIFEEKWIS